MLSRLSSRASVGVRLALLSCVFVAVIFAAFTTSLKKQDGSRAIGTLLDRKGPAYALVLANRTYTGLAQLFGKQYITQYKPILDASGHVIGALFVGVDVGEQIDALKSEIAKLKIGESGYYFVMDASNGPGRGTFLVHPGAAGKHYDDADAPWSRMLEAREGTLDYTSADTRARFAAFVSVPQWQWLVGGVAVRDEIMAEVNATRDRFAAIGLALVVLFAALSIYAARRIVSQPPASLPRATSRCGSATPAATPARPTPRAPRARRPPTKSAASRAPSTA